MTWTRPWRWPAGWARASNEQAVDNARAATVACSRRLVERADAAAYVERVDRERSRRPARPA
ncbi:hypothetical protein [Nocardioides abyssi]|uniref:Uncharacterized protein n=1 Tax=Nocardioides abyssi TaxID=3058370 RepID=A0ABT8EY77_9ACTN|nr:hypothetical protein [Nocardioides abyssi]MDN4163141.1 hypothetical protein [Nocardioides abyssi]